MKGVTVFWEQNGKQVEYQRACLDKNIQKVKLKFTFEILWSKVNKMPNVPVFFSFLFFFQVYFEKFCEGSLCDVSKV